MCRSTSNLSLLVWIEFFPNYWITMTVGLVWTHTLKRKGFHQLLSFNEDEKENINGFKIKGWWWRGDIKVTKFKSTFEYWVTGAPGKSQERIKTTLTVPRQNYDKDSYIIDLDSHEKTYWLGTESGLLVTFHFDEVCTSGDDSCDVVSYSMSRSFVI